MTKLLTEYNSLIQNLFEKAKEENIYLVTRIQQLKNFSVIYKNSKLDKVNLISDRGIGLYTFTDKGYLAFGTTNNLNDSTEVMELLISTAKVAHKNQDNNFDNAKEIYDLPKQDNLGEDKIHYNTNNITAIDLNEIEKYIREREHKIKDYNKQISGVFRFIIEDEQWRITRSDGTDVDFSIPKTRFYVYLTLKDGTNSSSTFYKQVSTTYEEFMKQDTQEIDLIIRRNIDSLQDQINAQSIEPGHYPLLIDTDLCGMLVHEAFGHACESDAIAEDASVLRNKDGKFKVGEKVAAEGINIYDFEEKAGHGFHPYGAFGNQRQKVQLVKNGILKESISDIFTANKINVEVKNCERSESYAHIAIPRMSNTYLEIDENKRIEVDNILDLTHIKDIQKAAINGNLFERNKEILVLLHMTGGQVETKLGDFMFGVGYVYKITLDTITVYKPCSFSGKVLDALKSISGFMGDMSKEAAGFCGKNGQTVCVNTGGHKLVLFDKSLAVNIS